MQVTDLTLEVTHAANPEGVNCMVPLDAEICKSAPPATGALLLSAFAHRTYWFTELVCSAAGKPLALKLVALDVQLKLPISSVTWFATL